MLAEIRGRSQITIPAEIIKKLGICEGDKFEVMEKDGGIFLCPASIYSACFSVKLSSFSDGIFSVVLRPSPNTFYLKLL